MSTEHTVKSFDEELRTLDSMISEMGGLAEAQLAAAIDCLVKRDSERAEKVVTADERIDDLEHEIDERAIRLVALRQPMAEDLRAIIAALKTSSVLERIGDYAKNIAKRTVALSQAPPVGPARSIARMGSLAQRMIKNVLDAYVQRDADKAEDVRQSDKDVDAMHTSLFRELLTYMMEDARSIGSCTHLLFVAKNIERIGDHATGIAENVIYLVRGDTVSHKRPKQDASSFTVVEPGGVAVSKETAKK